MFLRSVTSSKARSWAMMPSIIAGEKTWCSSRSQTIGILGSMDIHIDVSPLCHLKSIGHLEAVTTSDAESSQQLIEVGRAVGRAHLYRLLDARVVFRLLLQWIGLVAHVHIGSPTQRHANEHRAVPVAPAYVRRSLLMGHKTEIAGRIFVAKGGDGRRKVHHTCYHFTGSLRQHAVGQHLVLAVLHHPHVDMQA